MGDGLPVATGQDLKVQRLFSFLRSSPPKIDDTGSEGEERGGTGGGAEPGGDSCRGAMDLTTCISSF